MLSYGIFHGGNNERLFLMDMKQCGLSNNRRFGGIYHLDFQGNDSRVFVLVQNSHSYINILSSQNCRSH
jgi:hypothetical protein